MSKLEVTIEQPPKPPVPENIYEINKLYDCGIIVFKDKDLKDAMHLKLNAFLFGTQAFRFDKQGEYFYGVFAFDHYGFNDLKEAMTRFADQFYIKKIAFSPKGEEFSIYDTQVFKEPEPIDGQEPDMKNDELLTTVARALGLPLNRKTTIELAGRYNFCIVTGHWFEMPLKMCMAVKEKLGYGKDLNLTFDFEVALGKRNILQLPFIRDETKKNEYIQKIEQIDEQRRKARQSNFKVFSQHVDHPVKPKPKPLPILYIAFDNVLANTQKTEQRTLRAESNQTKPLAETSGKIRNFSEVKYAIEAYEWIAPHFETHILLTDTDTDVIEQKRFWIREHLGEKVAEQIVVTKPELLTKGRLVITAEGPELFKKFDGHVVRFGSSPLLGWPDMADFVYRLFSANDRPPRSGLMLKKGAASIHWPFG